MSSNGTQRNGAGLSGTRLNGVRPPVAWREDPAPGGESVEVVIPARPDMLRIVRLSAAAIAVHAELPYEDLDDLCLAIDELGVLVMGTPGDDGRLRVCFSWDADAVTVRCALIGTDRTAPVLRAPASFGVHQPASGSWQTTPPEAASLAHLILDALVDDYGLSLRAGCPTGWLQKRCAKAAD